MLDLKSKLIEYRKIKQSNNCSNIDFKKELMLEANKFNEVNSSLANKIAKLEVEKTKLFYQLQNYENAIKKNEKRIKSLNDNVDTNQNTIVKLNLKIEALITENSRSFAKDLNSIKEELEREKGVNFLLNKKVIIKLEQVEELQKLLGQYKIENDGKSKIIEERNLEIKQLKINFGK